MSFKLFSRVSLLAILAGCALLSGIYIGFLQNTSNEPSSFRQETITGICSIFEVDNEDPFCSTSAPQTTYTLEAMLQRRFPLEVTHYDDVMRGLDVITVMPPRWGSDVSEQFAIGICPTQDISEAQNWYTCYIAFREDIYFIYARFEKSSNNLLQISTSKPGS